MSPVRDPWIASPVHLVRGLLIGAAEAIPGVSGGTIALVTGVYETLVSSADHLLRACRLFVAAPFRRGDLARADAELRKVAWPAVLPILFGMAVAVVAAARVIEPLLAEHAQGARAVFAGIILASVIVPLRMIGQRLGVTDSLLIVVVAAATALLLGFPPVTIADPMLILVACAAAVAVCALVLPGVSGSFLLLSVGLYTPTIAAVNDRNLTYLLVFALGALLGLGLFVKALRWLLEHRRRSTLTVMAGLMLGSLRALWPWQDADRTLENPTGDVFPIAVLFVLGMAAVLLLLVTDSRIRARQTAANGSGDEPRAEDANRDESPLG